MLPEGTQPVPASSTALVTELPPKMRHSPSGRAASKHVPVACVVLNRSSATFSKPQQNRAGLREKAMAMDIFSERR